MRADQKIRQHTFALAAGLAIDAECGCGRKSRWPGEIFPAEGIFRQCVIDFIDIAVAY